MAFNEHTVAIIFGLIMFIVSMYIMYEIDSGNFSSIKDTSAVKNIKNSDYALILMSVIVAGYGLFKSYGSGGLNFGSSSLLG